MDELTNSPKEIIGLILINKFKYFLSANKPDSGFFSLVRSSYFGPPTAPSKTASDFLILSLVSSGNGLFRLSTATPPNKPWSISTSKLYRSEITLITFNPSDVTSAPTPSPGKIKIFIFLSIKYPRCFYKLTIFIIFYFFT